MSAAARGREKHAPALIALLDGTVVGAISQGPNARLRFTYDPAWQAAEDSYPLSLSMPLTAAEHGHDAVNAYLWGLLPDNERTLDHYARRFGVSAQSPVAMLAHIGADCAGAVQLVPPDMLQTVTQPQRGDDVEWIDAAEVARELRSAKETGLPGRDRRTVGRFSLAGAQPKIALFHRAGRWGRPLGRTPTTHILKPPSTEYAGFAENEHLCLDLAAELGLVAARSTVQAFEDEVAIVVERFDRVTTPSGHRRIHQEDMCQALSTPPWSKYENQGGPGISEIVELLTESSADPDVDIARFVDMLAVNWVLAATDAHAKNYAILHGPGGAVRLAPFYDVASYLPYADRDLHDVKLAMRIGKEYLVRRVTRRAWTALAAAARLRPDDVIGRVDVILARIPDAVTGVAARAVDDGLDRRHVVPLSERIIEHSRTCAARLHAGRGAAGV